MVKCIIQDGSMDSKRGKERILESIKSPASGFDLII